MLAVSGRIPKHSSKEHMLTFYKSFNEIRQGVYALGNAILIFMEIATGIALVIGILFQPRT